MSGGNPRFEAVVFAGGGSRCFWQLGFWAVAAPELGLAPRLVSAVSAGSAIACAALLQRCEETLRRFQRATSRNPRNAYPANLLSGEPVFPHHRMYREAILEVVDEAALRRLHEGPELRVVIGLAPPWIVGRLALLLGLGCFLVGKRAGDPVHSPLARRAGFSATVVSVRSCRTPQELAELCIASSCTPPFTPALRWQGRPVVDGSLYDPAPLFAIEDDLASGAQTLVLLSRRYGRMPAPVPGRIYVSPSRPVAISKWDYTSPEKLQQAYDLGRADAERFVREHVPRRIGWQAR